jgi:predicted permease
MERLTQDMQLAVRRLIRAPAFSVIAVLTLAIGIGANTAIFSLINAIRLRPLPFNEPGRLVDVFEHNPVEVCDGCGVGTSFANYADWRAQAKSFSAMGAHTEGSVALGLPDGAEPRRISRVTAGLFPMLGVTPTRGRLFTEDDDRAGAAPVALIGAGLWRARFNSDSTVVGKSVRLDGVQYRIIGVMPDHFAFPDFAELWVPMAGSLASSPRNEREIGVVARLAPGVTTSSAQAEMDAIATRLERAYPGEQKGWTAHMTSLHDDLARDYAAGFTMALGAVGCVLLIACANLANLMLARATTRRGELALRAALGASRANLARQFLIEATIISLFGGLLGLVLASWGMEVLPAIQGLAGEGLPAWIRYEFDWRVFAFALGISLLTGLAFGGFAARYAMKSDLEAALKETGRSVAGARSKVRNALVVVQIATAVVLVVVGGLFAKAMLRGQLMDRGYDPANITRADVGPSLRQTDSTRGVAEFATRLTEALAARPGVQSAAMSGLYVVNWPGMPHETITADEHEPDAADVPVSHISIITPSHFDVLGVPLLEGRAFTKADAAGSVPVALVNSTLARRVWPGSSAVGKHIRIGDVSWTIVGVAPDFRGAFATGVRPTMYAPLAQLPKMQPANQTLSLLVRTAPGTGDIARAIRTAAVRIDPDATTNLVMSEEAFTRRLRSPYEGMAMLAGSLGLFALLLASIGIYGVISYFVGQRMHELGVRVALGASPLNIVQLVVRYGFNLGLVGVIIGGIAAAGATRLIGYRLFGVSPTDPVVFGGVAVVFLGVAMLAAYLPARRATKVDPMIALRSE